MKKMRFTEYQKCELLWWANVLESTTKMQGQNALKQYEEAKLTSATPVLTYCCLGVYAEAREPNIWDGQVGDEFFIACDLVGLGHKVTSAKDDYVNKNTTYLPDHMKKALGMSSKNNEGLDEKFAAMNDQLDYTFKDIAAEIRVLARTGRFTPETAEELENSCL